MSPCIWMTPGIGAMDCKSTATIFAASSSSRLNVQNYHTLYITLYMYKSSMMYLFRIHKRQNKKKVS